MALILASPLPYFYPHRDTERIESVTNFQGWYPAFSGYLCFFVIVRCNISCTSTNLSRTRFLFYVGSTGLDLECYASEGWHFLRLLTGWVAVLRSPTMVQCAPREDPGPSRDPLRARTRPATLRKRNLSEHRSPTS